MVQKFAEHSKELIRAFAPIRFFLIIIGQMPFEIRKKKDNTYSFKLTFKSKSLYIFFFFFLINTVAYLLVTFGIATFILKDLAYWIKPHNKIITKDELTSFNTEILWETYFTRKEMVAVLVVWSWMTIAFAGSLYIILYGKFYVHYMNYFNRVVQLMDMDMTPGIREYLWRHNLFSILIAVLLTFGYGLQDFGFNAVGNTASVIANFIFRIFNIEIQTLSNLYFRLCQGLGFVIMLLALFGSRANIIQFLFFSQLLKNGTKIWNERFTKALEIDQSELIEDEEDDDQLNRRLELRHVVKDHLILLQLFQMTDSVFGPILFIFYCFQIVSVVVEIYQLAALGGFNDLIVKKETATSNFSSTENPYDDSEAYVTDEAKEFETLSSAIVCIVLLLQNVYFAISTTTDAACAYEQAMEGFHILRQHGFMYCRNPTDRNFVWSMYLSFSKTSPMVLTAGGYFAVNRALLVAMAGTIVNWAVSIYQTRIDQWK